MQKLVRRLAFVGVVVGQQKILFDQAESLGVAARLFEVFTLFAGLLQDFLALLEVLLGVGLVSTL